MAALVEPKTFQRKRINIRKETEEITLIPLYQSICYDKEVDASRTAFATDVVNHDEILQKIVHQQKVMINQYDEQLPRSKITAAVSHRILQERSGNVTGS